MDKKLLMLIGLLFIVLITQQYVNCAPADEKEDPEYLQDDDNQYDDYEDVKDDDNRKGSSTTVPTAETLKSSLNYTHKVDAGKSVRLDCKGEVHFDDTTVILWYNDTQIIVQGISVTPSANKKVQYSKKDGALIIDDVDSYDNGKYKCRIYFKHDIYETNHYLFINGPPSNIQVGYNRDDKTIKEKEVLAYKAGEKDLRFKCSVGNAHPAVKYTWNHNGNAIQEVKDRDIKFVEENILEIRVLHARHAGDYQCEATNEYGSVKFSYKIDVQYAPFFRPHHTYFNAEIGYNAVIFCTYKASPSATSIKWIRDGNQIHESSKYKIKADMKENHDRTILEIVDVETSDLGLYHCEVQNTLGTKKENVTLDLVPAPPKFEGYKYINDYVYVDWVVKSHQEIESMVILFRNNANGWNQTETKITNSNKVRDGEWKVQGSLSLEYGEWTIAGRAKNSNGWSNDALAQHTTIRVPKDETTEQPAGQTSSASSIVSSVCGSLIALLISRYFV